MSTHRGWFWAVLSAVIGTTATMRLALWLDERRQRALVAQAEHDDRMGRMMAEMHRERAKDLKLEAEARKIELRGVVREVIDGLAEAAGEAEGASAATDDAVAPVEATEVAMGLDGGSQVQEVALVNGMLPDGKPPTRENVRAYFRSLGQSEILAPRNASGFHVALPFPVPLTPREISGDVVRVKVPVPIETPVQFVCLMAMAQRGYEKRRTQKAS